MAAESKLETALRLHAESLGFRLLKWVSPGTKGVPDRILLARHGVAMLMEFKAPGETPAPWQEREIADFRERGFSVEVIDDLDTGIRIMDEIAEMVERMDSLEQLSAVLERAQCARLDS